MPPAYCECCDRRYKQIIPHYKTQNADLPSPAERIMSMDKSVTEKPGLSSLMNDSPAKISFIMKRNKVNSISISKFLFTFEIPVPHEEF